MISLLFMSAGDSFLKAINSTGKIALYQKTVLVTAVWVFPLSYLAFKLGGKPQVSYVIMTLVNIVVVLERVFIARKLVQLPLRKVFTDVVQKALLVTLVASIPPVLVWFLMPGSLARALVVTGLSVLSVAIGIYFLGTTPGEREAVRGMVQKVFKR